MKLYKIIKEGEKYNIEYYIDSEFQTKEFYGKTLNSGYNIWNGYTKHPDSL